MPSYSYLSKEQVDHFLEYGYIVIKDAFTKEKAAEWTKGLWVRLGLDPDDKSTWDRERIHMPVHKREEVTTFSPKVMNAMVDLLGGEDRIDLEASTWGDGFIINLGTRDGTHIDPQDLDNWHVDGDFFVHYFDSPEQALVVIPIFSDIESGGGGTMISPDSIGCIARYLWDHPEGVLPTGLSFTPSTSKKTNVRDDPGYFSFLAEIKDCSQFVELTGKVGDVALLHPFMLHSASKNPLRVPRVIINPPASLKEPFSYSRVIADDYSLVERKTLKALGVESAVFTPTTERRRVVPKRIASHAKALEEEKQRLVDAGLV
ncbi:uncharacterized protein BT62DRAFT_927572 [Guyanagaster necrorhizus]|uniref:Phytanoyl-CoA dioxygenase n=1 Tax=Guyanagaster necrorhizus TaxID=856835 RepID=A0A9P7W135_9AGAR|nr:uncharacterized protein BT62DRAFT_927572 [Guyanagaster necrorhizus MCA 3950]KAG7450252.1 hypothetical protein BT62DRAFT_927572 [Guyanagaster necrorhizus MCA 3950]